MQSQLLLILTLTFHLVHCVFPPSIKNPSPLSLICHPALTDFPSRSSQIYYLRHASAPVYYLHRLLLLSIVPLDALVHAEMCAKALDLEPAARARRFPPLSEAMVSCDLWRCRVEVGRGRAVMKDAQMEEGDGS
jgi:hypothetical protein